MKVKKFSDAELAALLNDPRLVEDAVWVRACAKLIEQEGSQQFLVNLLYVLRECFQEES